MWPSLEGCVACDTQFGDWCLGRCISHKHVLLCNRCCLWLEGCKKIYRCCALLEVPTRIFKFPVHLSCVVSFVLHPTPPPPQFLRGWGSAAILSASFPVRLWWWLIAMIRQQVCRLRCVCSGWMFILQAILLWGIHYWMANNLISREKLTLQWPVAGFTIIIASSLLCC